jgi:hypothetical protein
VTPNDERDFFWSVGVVVFLLVAFAILTRCETARAQDLPTAEVQLPEVGETLALDPQERAPWAGMLVRDEDLQALQSHAFALELELRNARGRIDEVTAGRGRLLEEQARLCEERVQLHVGLWRDRAEEIAVQLEAARRRLAAGPEWYEHPATWFAIGGAVVGALVGAIAAAVAGG